MLVVALHPLVHRRHRELVRLHVPVVPVAPVVELDETHVRPVDLRHHLAVALYLALEVVRRLPTHLRAHYQQLLCTYVVEGHLGHDLVLPVLETHLALCLQLHGPPEAAAVLLARVVVLHALPVVELDAALALVLQRQRVQTRVRLVVVMAVEAVALLRTVHQEVAHRRVVRDLLRVQLRPVRVARLDGLAQDRVQRLQERAVYVEVAQRGRYDQLDLARIVKRSCVTRSTGSPIMAALFT